MKPIVAKSTWNLPRCRLVDLDQPVSLVRLTTRAGFSIEMSAETIFSLRHVDGLPVIMPAAPPPMASIDWHAPIEDADDPRFWFIGGLMIANGKYAGPPLTIPAQITIPGADPFLVQCITDFLCAFRATLAAKSPTRLARMPQISHAGNSTRFAARLIDIILEGPCGGFVNPQLRLPDMQTLLHLRRPSQAAFVSGFLRGLETEGGDKVFRHRAAALLRDLHALLFNAYGMPTTLSINPHYAEIMAQNRLTLDGHHLRLRSEHFGFALRAGFDVGEPVRNRNIVWLTDALADVRDAGKRPAVEIHGDGEHCVAGGFVFDTEFQTPDAALDLATLDELFTR